MNILTNVIIFTITFLLGHITGKYIFMFFNVLKFGHGKHICNKCECGFLSNYHELNFIYCPYCGEPLDFHSYDKRSKDYDGDEQ